GHGAVFVGADAPSRLIFASFKPIPRRAIARPQASPLGVSMSTLTEEQARAYMHKLLAAMNQAGGSDLFIASDFPPSMKAHGSMKPLTSQKLAPDMTRM